MIVNSKNLFILLFHKNCHAKRNHMVGCCLFFFFVSHFVYWLTCVKNHLIHVWSFGTISHCFCKFMRTIRWNVLKERMKCHYNLLLVLAYKIVLWKNGTKYTFEYTFEEISSCSTLLKLLSFLQGKVQEISFHFF